MMDELYCSGCGARLQIEDETKDGYIEKKALQRETFLCKRCYQLKHYGKFVEGNSTFHTIKMVHQSIKKEDVVLFLVDLPLVLTPFLNAFKELKRYPNLYLLVNRFDLYQTFISKEKAFRFISKESKKFQLNFKEIIFLDEIESFIDQILIEYPHQNIALVGIENVGKTTLIQKILKQRKQQKSQLVASIYPGTTLQPLKIHFDDNHDLYDTPGILSKTSFLHHLPKGIIKRLQLDKKVVQTAYQLNACQAIHINNFLSFHYLNGNKQGIIFYHSPQCVLTRTKLQNAISTFDALISQYSIKVNSIHSFNDLTAYPITITEGKKDIVIEGFGFVTVTQPGEFMIYTFKDCQITIRDAMI